MTTGEKKRFNKEKKKQSINMTYEFDGRKYYNAITT